MGENYLISTIYEFESLDNKEKKIISYLNDNAKKFDFDKNFISYKAYKNSLSSKNNCAKLVEKIFDQLYSHLINHYNFEISKKAYRIILEPFLNNFVEIVYYKYENYNQFILKNKNLKIFILDKSSFVHFDNFEEFISLSQKDFFNTQLNTEIINFNKYNNYRKVLKLSGIKPKLKKIKNKILNSFKFVKIKKNFNIKKKKIDQIINFYKLDFRHNEFLKKILKYKHPKKKNLDKNFLKNFRLEYCNQDIKLREIIIKKLKCKLKIDQFVTEMVIKYLPSIYFEAVKNNFLSLDNRIKSVPKILISNAHGWWTDDNFKYYAGFCIENFTKYIEVQHNGTYFIINKNPHYEISKNFRDYFLGWGGACEKKKNNIKLPVLYNINSQINKIKDNYNTKSNKILFMGASIKRYFGGYSQSYLNGGNSFLYYNAQFQFLKNLSNETRKKIILRLRHNKRDPRGYIDCLKKNFNDLKSEDISTSAASRLADHDIKIVVVDHCSTPWLEALQANKPLILFWDKAENSIHHRYLPLMNMMKKYKIYFDCPIAAAKRLEEIYKKDIKWWYKEKKIQNLRIKILKSFFYSQNKPIKKWNDVIKKIYYEN